MEQVPASLSRDELNSLPVKSYEGPIDLIDTRERLSRIVDALQNDLLWGFDTESRPAFRKGQYFHASLLQAAVRDRVVLIRLNKTGITAPLVRLLSESSIIKAGVGIRDDLRKLTHQHRFAPAGFVELSDMARQKGHVAESLRKLSGALLGFRISKSAQLTNWEAPTLTDKQLQYAATDAWVSREVYLRLTER
jgi:ribonuclease D